MCLGLNVGMCIIMVMCNVFVCNGILMSKCDVVQVWRNVEVLKYWKRNHIKVDREKMRSEINIVTLSVSVCDVRNHWWGFFILRLNVYSRCSVETMCSRCIGQGIMYIYICFLKDFNTLISSQTKILCLSICVCKCAGVYVDKYLVKEWSGLNLCAWCNFASACMCLVFYTAKSLY